ncbi:MAG: SUMF1/EgtB/PvdO family nonheme iron enzyme [Nitrospiraceae bacterium]|nr:SUMF1/EgtB/PvdO family nonheme iron enzyme [Nitrospiraceae bacterium]
MKKALLLVLLLGLDVSQTMAEAPVDKGAKKTSSGYDLLNQQKFQEARAAFEADLQKNPANAVAHFYLGDACRGLKAWACAEAHYETSLELDAQSSVAGLAKQRGRKAKVWRLLDEVKEAVNEPNVPLKKVTVAENTLDIVIKLGLDDEQQVVYHQLQDKIPQTHKRSLKKTVSSPHQDQSMVLIPAGDFTMGSSMGDPDELPVRKVYVDAFFIDKHQTSVGKYGTFLDATSHEAPADWDVMNKSMHQKRPVVNVDWADAEAYCKWAGKRLATEAEWEKAARGTDGRIYPWGNELPTDFHANMKKEVWNNHVVLTPVGMFEGGKSPYGVYDMAGNVWEWINDWYSRDYYKTGPLKNPTGPSKGDYKVIRGGSWGSSPKDLRSTDRESRLPSFGGLGTGFRCAKTP